MSHSVTVTRTVISSNDTVVNMGYIKTVPGLLKLVQLILGGIGIGIVAYHHDRYLWYHYSVPDLFFLLMATTFFIGTFCLLVSCLFSHGTGGNISKTIHELIYHTAAAILILAASIYMLVKVQRNLSDQNSDLYKFYTAASVLGILNGILYIWSAVFARKSYGGI